MLDLQAKYFQSMFDYSNDKMRVTFDDQLGLVNNQVVGTTAPNTPLIVHYNGNAKYSNAHKIIAKVTDPALFRRNVVKEIMKGRKGQKEFEEYVRFFHSYEYGEVKGLGLEALCPQEIFDGVEERTR